MTAAQKLIVWDYLSRWRWALSTGAILHLTLMTTAGWSGEYSLIGMLFCSAILLHFDLARSRGGVVRTLLSLPITAAELSRCWRFVGFTLPAVAGFLILVLGRLLGMVFGAPHISGQAFVIAALGQTLALGAIYFSFVGIMAKPDASVPKIRFTNVLTGLIVGIAFPLFIFAMISPLPGKWEEMGLARVIAAVLLAAAAMSGWFQSEDAALRRLAKPGAASKRRNHSETSAAASWLGFGGIGFFLQRTGRQLVLMFALMVTMGWGVPQLMGASSPHYIIICMFVFISVYIGVTTILAQLRPLRTLPLSRRALAHLLVFWPWALTMISNAIPALVTFFIFGNSTHWLPWDSAFAAAVAATLLLPLILRFGLKWWVILVLMSLTLVFFLYAQVVVSPPDWRLILALGAAVLALVWTLTYRLLGSPHPWRAGAFLPPFQARRTS